MTFAPDIEASKPESRPLTTIIIIIRKDGCAASQTTRRS